MRRWNGHSRPTRVTEKHGDWRRFFVVYNIDHQPFLSKGRAFHGNVQHAPDGTSAAITGQEIVAPDFLQHARGCTQSDNDAALGLFE